MHKVERLLVAILSIKEKKVIGYSFKTLVEIPNHFFNPKNERNYSFAFIILEAIKTYYGIELFLKNEDLKGSFRNKVIEFEKSNIPNNTEFNGIIKYIFKDLIL